MAQRQIKRAPKRRALAKRFGITGGRAAAIACATLVAALALVGVVRASGTLGLTLERGEETQTQLDGSSSGDASDSSESSDAAQGQADAQEGPVAQEGQETETKVVVHVDGAVMSPGVYELSGDGLRVNDAVAAAGGLSDDADTTSINLAAALSDGEKIYVPRQGEDAASGATSSGLSETLSGTSASGSAAGSSGTQLVNINTADEATLQTLPGVGEATAANIVQDREQNGPFATIEDLMRVSGIGEKKFEKVKDLICV